MLLSGFHPLTLLDYPGRTACIVFTVGCNFRCGFCHNPDFVVPEKIAAIKNSFIQTKEFFTFLERRQGILDGVTICGGEPTLHHDLEDFIRKIKAMGFLVKLDTNGSNPKVLEKLISESLIDAVAMDIKRPIDEYSTLNTATGKDETLPEKLRESIKILEDSALEIEFRTTVAKWVHDENSIRAIMQEIPENTARYALQNFRMWEILNPDFSGVPFSHEELEKLAQVAKETQRSSYTEILIRK